MPRVVLVVDDEPLVLEVTATMLDDLGCETVTAASGKEALEKLARWIPPFNNCAPASASALISGRTRYQNVTTVVSTC